MTLLADIVYDKMFGFFYSIYDYFQPQQKFYCYSFGGMTSSNTYDDSEPYKEIIRLIHQSNNITENPDKMGIYDSKAEFKNFYLGVESIAYLYKPYLYPYYMRGSNGLIISISCGDHEDIDQILSTKYSVSLYEIFELSKYDDRAKFPPDSLLLDDFGIPEKKNNFRPILVVISLVGSEEVIEKIKLIIENNIERTRYERQNTMVVVHTEERSNLYEGLEWLFEKSSVLN